MKRNILCIIAILAVVFFAMLVLHKPKTRLPLQPAPMASVVQASNSEVRVVSNNPMANQPNAATTSSQNTSISPDIEARYRQGIIGKEQAIAEAYNRRFDQPQNIYGKIIDQYEQPVVSVNVSGSIEYRDASGQGLKIQTFETHSDLQGLFEFTGKTGAPIKFVVKKEGYLMGQRGEGYQGPPSEKTTPYDRSILTMWKLRGAEPLLDSSIDSKIPYDGTPIAFDIATGKQSADGDLRITLARTPLEVRRSGQEFDWTIKIEMRQGGLLLENVPYPYWAPESGYNPSFEVNVNSNNVSWYSHLTQNFYIKNAHGQYGRMQVNVYAALTPARIQLNFTVNPSGSQNLEPPNEE